MNPSATGWIKKLLLELDKHLQVQSTDINALYFSLRSSGFIYGSNQSVVNNYIDEKGLSKEEICKINLIIALYVTHKSHTTINNFIESVISFYIEINEHKTSVFKDLINGKKSSLLLEKIIHKRIQLDDNFITKNFNYFITNALLFVDILAYKQFLVTQHISIDYIKNLEAAIETVTINVLNAKEDKTKYDNSLIKLIESSLRYQQNDSITYKKAIKFIKTPLEAHYVLDIACMATWSDQVIDRNEKIFLQQIGIDINLNDNFVNESISQVNKFYVENKDNIALLSSKNLVKSFYDNSSEMVSKLISRNSKRLLKELKESKELMVILSKSTVRELTNEEQKKVQEQLMDIFKSIPSLAIFMLPGGALLLPLVVKFIPKLLPSAFDDNRIEEN